jgi:hypothetical protein
MPETLALNGLPAGSAVAFCAILAKLALMRIFVARGAIVEIYPDIFHKRSFAGFDDLGLFQGNTSMAFGAVHRLMFAGKRKF